MNRDPPRRRDHTQRHGVDVLQRRSVWQLWCSAEHWRRGDWRLRRHFQHGRRGLRGRRLHGGGGLCTGAQVGPTLVAGRDQNVCSRGHCVGVGMVRTRRIKAGCATETMSPSHFEHAQIKECLKKTPLFDSAMTFDRYDPLGPYL